MIANPKPISFRLGQMVATPGAIEAIASAGQSPLDFISKHQRGDWGEVGKEDWDANNQALKDGTRLLSSYATSRGVKIWIITEADRSATTILLPEEY